MKQILLELLQLVHPFYLRFCPPLIANRLFARLYRSKASSYKRLFDSARLRYAPSAVMRLESTCHVHKEIALLGYYELSLTADICKHALAGGVLVDVGANFGYYSVLWASANSKNRVIAIEASPRNIGPLQFNISRNNLDDNVKVIPVAAGNQPGKVRFDLGPSDQSGWGMLSESNSDSSVEVEMVRLDDLLLQHDIKVVSVLKIDAEGADAMVLEGCSQYLAKHLIQRIYFEINIEKQVQLAVPADAAFNILRRNGYRYSVLDEQTGEYYAEPVGTSKI